MLTHASCVFDIAGFGEIGEITSSVRPIHMPHVTCCMRYVNKPLALYRPRKRTLEMPGRRTVLILWTVTGTCRASDNEFFKYKNRFHVTVEQSYAPIMPSVVMINVGMTLCCAGLVRKMLTRCYACEFSTYIHFHLKPHSHCARQRCSVSPP